MVKLDVALLNFEEFKSNYERKRGSYSNVITLSNIVASVGTCIAIVNLYENNVVFAILGLFLVCLVYVFQQCYSLDMQQAEYKGVTNLLDTLDENDLFYYVDEDVLTTNNTIIKGLDYEVVKSTHNQLMDSYKDGEYKLILEVCDDTSRD